MEKSADRYLHKKFKKQLSIDPGCTKSTKSVITTTTTTSTSPTISRTWEDTTTTTTTTTTKENVPKDSTNSDPYESMGVKSSISLERVEPIPCSISHVVSRASRVAEAPQIRIVYFDSKFNRGVSDTSSWDISSSVKCEPSLPGWDGPDGGHPSEIGTNEKNAVGGAATGKYVCSYCNLACSKPSVLQKHIRAHTNERPFPCVSCGFSFKTRSNLYKHCRSRTHANRVMGNRTQENVHEMDMDGHGRFDYYEHAESGPEDFSSSNHGHNEQEVRTKPYKPRFHTMNLAEPSEPSSNYHQQVGSSDDEPLNLTNKNRKRCLSEVAEPGTHKSLIKELLLKNLYADTNMQCPHCRMYFQTVTELELHKMRSCKAFTKSGARYSRSSSVNVASILTKNKNAFDNIPHLHNASFPLKSPGPFLGKTSLVESDKNKSFSFDDNLSTAKNNSYPIDSTNQVKPKRAQPVRLFGGEVKIANTSSAQNRSYKIENAGKMSENRVVQSSLQSGGTVMQGKKDTVAGSSTSDVIRVYENTSLSPSIDLANLEKTRFIFDKQCKSNSETLARTPTDAVPYKYTNIMDFSQKAVKMLAPNLKQPSLSFISGKSLSPLTLDIKADSCSSPRSTDKMQIPSPQNACNPMNLLVNGKVVRYVPGMPGPVVADQKMEVAYGGRSRREKSSPIEKTILETKPTSEPPRKFARPNTLALKPSPAHKQHHGLTPTMFNQILISPDTPRVAKKYVQQFLHGTYFSYLGLKSSTKSVYCTLNKTQPFYVPHFNKLSMYSEWRQDTQTDKLYVSGFDSRQRHGRFTLAGKATADLVVHSSYRGNGEIWNNREEDPALNNSRLGGYESNEEYTYVRGRGRGRYVCDQCGIRCKKPSMLKKHIRTHTNDRPYTCSPCNFSFKTKGNLTKHMKSKAHTKNYEASSSSSSSAQQSGTQSSESDSDDSGMDSSDDSTRQQEHEAAYGLLSLSQKNTQHFGISSQLDNAATSPTLSNSSSSTVGLIDASLNFMNREQVTQINNSSIAKNKILDRQVSIINLNTSKFVTELPPSSEPAEITNLSQFLGKTSTSRPLTYPYTSLISDRSPTSPKNKGMASPNSAEVRRITSSCESDHYMDKVPTTPIVKVNDRIVLNKDAKKRRVEEDRHRRNHCESEAMDLTTNSTRVILRYNGNENENDTCTPMEIDNSAMETLADVATKQVKLERNTLAKSVASEFLKFATNHIGPSNDGSRETNNFINSGKDVLEFIGKPEENKSCTICSKNFSKPSQLRLHMNVHYLERPFRCDPCSVSFRTKGHLQKHERSASHHNKLSSSPLLSSSEPRPFKCSDCNIAFRIHGHLAKHLRSKMHIMKLECLAKIPFGLYAELERANSLLTEINTTDGDQCLESLKALAVKVFMNDPSKLSQLEMEINNANTTDS